MSSDIRIYLNPKCTKCRLSMQLLDDNGITPEVVEYLNQPPTVAELTEILDLLALAPRELMRQHEAPYKELNLSNDSLSHDELIQAMVDNPILIERPIVIKGNKATIGRPPEKILDIL
jgi:arsenate reductase